MAVILFRLNGVPEDEAQQVRDLLAEHQINFYETSGGNWGVSFAAIWLPDNARLAEARALIDRYQAQRRERIRGEFGRVKAARGARVVFDAVRENPLRSLLYLAVAVVFLYFSTVPFFNFTDWLRKP